MQPAVLENTPHELLGLFGTVIDTVVEPTKAHYHSQSCHQDIDMLQSPLEGACIHCRMAKLYPVRRAPRMSKAQSYFG